MFWRFILPTGITCAFVKRLCKSFYRQTICKIVLLKIRKAQLMAVERIGIRSRPPCKKLLKNADKPRAVIREKIIFIKFNLLNS